MISLVEDYLSPLNTTKTTWSLAMSSEIITQNKNESVSIPRIDLSIILLMADGVMVKDISDFFKLPQTQINTLFSSLKKKYLPRI